MTQAVSEDTGPGAILLATDLSCRCDRATDRAIRLARKSGARLVVVTAFEEADEKPSWRLSEGREAAVRAELGPDLDAQEIDWDVVIGEGDPAEAILAAAGSAQARLIVTGVARNVLLGRARPGKTVETLMRRSPVPLLVVKARVHGDYRRILAPTDLTRSGETALVRTLAMFPEAEVTALHAWRVPFAGFLGEQNKDAMKAEVEKEKAAFLARLEERLGRKPEFRFLLEFGEAEQLVGAFVADRDADLVVVGAHRPRERSGIADHILMEAACDVLVSPETAP